MKKGDLTSCAVQYTPAAVLYSTLLDRILRSYYFVCFLFIVILGDLLSHKHVILETVVDLCLLPPRRVIVTTGKGYLVPLNELKRLVSNIGSF